MKKNYQQYKDKCDGLDSVKETENEVKFSRIDSG